MGAQTLPQAAAARAGAGARRNLTLVKPAPAAAPRGLRLTHDAHTVVLGVPDTSGEYRASGPPA